MKRMGWLWSIELEHRVLSWIIALILLYSSLVSFIEFHIVAGLFYLIGTLILLPYARKKVFERTNITIPPYLRLLIILIIIFIGYNAGISAEQELAYEAKQKTLLKQSLEQDRLRLLHEKKFQAEKSNLLKQITADIETEQYDNILGICNKYVDVSDKDLNALCTQAKDKLERKALAAQEVIDQKKSEELWKEVEKESAKQEAGLKSSMGSKAWKLHKKHPSWSTQECKSVSEHRYWIGMSLDMLKANRGQPNSANPSDYGNGTKWQWCWRDYTPSCFYGGSDGIVTSYN